MKKFTYTFISLVALSVGAQDSILKQNPTLVTILAERMQEVAVRRADELNQKVAIVIVGSDGLPLTTYRSEDAPGLFYEQALEQAKKTWLTKNETPGGLPVVWKNHRIGGIGVAGSSSDSQNSDIAQSAKDVFTTTLSQNIPIQSPARELLKIILYVKPSKMEETAEFYRDAIGLPLTVNFGNWKMFEAGSVSLCLSLKEDDRSLRDKATNFALYSGTREEVAELHERLEQAGYRTTSDLNPEREKTMGVLRHERMMTTFWIKDPAGNTVQIESLRTR